MAAIAGLGAPLLRLLARTWRIETVGAEHLAAVGDGAAGTIYAFWHGRILHCMWHWRNRGIVVITSENFDGEWIARIIRRFGFGTARGSSSRGRRAGPACSWCARCEQAPVAFTVDGPRGPRDVVKPGVVWLAQATGHPVVCVHAEADRAWTMRSWDRTQIPKPFSRMVIVDRTGRARRRRRRDPTRSSRRAWPSQAALADAVRASRRALGRAEEP